MAVDVMLALEEVLGFSNLWYPLALETAVPQVLPSGIAIRLPDLEDKLRALADLK